MAHVIALPWRAPTRPPLTQADARKVQPPPSASWTRFLGGSARSCIDRHGRRRDAYRRPAFGSGRVIAAIWIGAAR
jgi:hypothetical protein